MFVHAEWRELNWVQVGLYLLVVPTLVAGVTRFRSFMRNLVGGGTAGAPVFFFLVEKLLVAYLAFAAGAALGLLVAR
jgi:hypothetical protein